MSKKFSELTTITGADTADDDFLPIVDLSANATKTITKAEAGLAFSGGVAGNIVCQGWWDYNDATTSGTPISLTGGAAFLKMTNDGAGTYTKKTYALPGITDIWVAADNQLDFSGLSIGDTVDVRIDISVTTGTSNQVVEIEVYAGIGGSAFSIPFYIGEFKTAAAHQIIESAHLYIGDANARDNPAEIRIKSDANASVVVSGWFVRVVPRKPVVIS